MESHGIPMEFVDFQLEKNLAANQKQKQGMSKTEADDARHKVGRIQMLSEVEDFCQEKGFLSAGFFSFFGTIDSIFNFARFLSSLRQKSQGKQLELLQLLAGAGDPPAFGLPAMVSLQHGTCDA